MGLKTDKSLLALQQSSKLRQGIQILAIKAFPAKLVSSRLMFRGLCVSPQDVRFAPRSVEGDVLPCVGGPVPSSGGRSSSSSALRSGTALTSASDPPNACWCPPLPMFLYSLLFSVICAAGRDVYPHWQCKFLCWSLGFFARSCFLFERFRFRWSEKVFISVRFRGREMALAYRRKNVCADWIGGGEDEIHGKPDRKQ